MRKIRGNFNQKDRIICVTVHGGHEFYYQPVGSTERIWLFETEDFSGSIFAYFRDKGRTVDGRGFGLTIKQMYEFKEFQNVKLCKLFTDRIPKMVEYVVRERLEQKEMEKKIITTSKEATHSRYCEDRELAA